MIIFYNHVNHEFALCVELTGSFCQQIIDLDYY